MSFSGADSSWQIEEELAPFFDGNTWPIEQRKRRVHVGRPIVNYLHIMTLFRQILRQSIGL